MQMPGKTIGEFDNEVDPLFLGAATEKRASTPRVHKSTHNTVRVLIKGNLCALCEAAPDGPSSAI